MSTTATTEPTIRPAAVDIRRWRESVGLSRASLAARAKCSVTHLANIEAGVVPSYGDVLPRLFEALNELEPPQHNGGSSKEGVGDATPADPATS